MPPGGVPVWFLHGNGSNAKKTRRNILDSSKNIDFLMSKIIQRYSLQRYPFYQCELQRYPFYRPPSLEVTLSRQEGWQCRFAISLSVSRLHKHQTDTIRAYGTGRPSQSVRGGHKSSWDTLGYLKADRHPSWSLQGAPDRIDNICILFWRPSHIWTY